MDKEIYDLSGGVENQVVLLCRISNKRSSSHESVNKLSFNCWDFEYIKTNIPGAGCEADLFSEQYAGCSCEGTCSSHSCSCLQRFGSPYTKNGKICMNKQNSELSKPVLECGNSCKCGTDCPSRVVQKGVTRSFCVFPTGQKGFGLKLPEGLCDNKIPAFTFVCEYAGEVIGHQEAKKRVLENEKGKKDNYIIALREHVGAQEKCTYFDPSKLGNAGRFINHSCDPNLIMVPVRVNHSVPRLALFARRDIMAGEEFTFDYSGKSTFFSTSLKEATLSNSTGTHIGLTLNEPNVDSRTVDEPPVKKSKLCSPSSLEPEDVEDVYNNTEGSGVAAVSLSVQKPGDPSPLLHCSRTVEVSAVPGSSSNTCSEVDSPKQADTFVDSENSGHFKLCFCGSENCQKYLPFDERLLSDEY
ncbi:histone-lysine N-methyltransferase SETMAR [Aplysia californica]|uniref:Histone-lysine N-methyltransferase SETMAR n=1 Tax=Aplysia californica TaxID=6500 RepID=A0ABM0JM81_APLCA|nr:histone-lysine N-methyltransferase SETMAR [Aplysia californica]